MWYNGSDNQQIFALLFTLSSTQNIMGSASMIRLGVNNALVCCLQTPQTHKSAIKISVPAESSHTIIGSLMAGNQTKEARLPKVS